MKTFHDDDWAEKSASGEKSNPKMKEGQDLKLASLREPLWLWLCTKARALSLPLQWYKSHIYTLPYAAHHIHIRSQENMLRKRAYPLVIKYVSTPSHPQRCEVFSWEICIPNLVHNCCNGGITTSYHSAPKHYDQSGMASSSRKNASGLMLVHPSVPVGAFFLWA